MKTFYIVAVLAVIIVAVVAFQLGKNQPPTGAVVQDDTPQSVSMEHLADDDVFLGLADAPVTIVEWSDYECPFCQRFYTETLPQIKEQYIDTGVAKLVFRDFPLPIHQNAQKAAEAAECAGDQDSYFEMHDKLFAEGVEGGITAFEQYAVDLGLDTEKFNTCLESGQFAQEVRDDMQDGQALGISGTPSFVINGVLVVGAQPFSEFQTVIDSNQ